MPTNLTATIRHILNRECPQARVESVRPLDRGHTSEQWVAATDEGRLLVKVPRRNRDPEHLKRLVASTRVAGEHGIPVVRYRRLVPYEAALDGPVVIQEYQEGDAADEVWESLDEGRRLVLLQDLGDVVGRLHAIEGPWFGDVLGGGRASSLRESVEAEAAALLSRADPELIGDPGRFRSAIAAAVARLEDGPNVPALTHGDLWLPNVLVRDGRISCVLDFEHAGYADRFRDFGKLDEHVFGPLAGRDVFLRSYAAACPLPDDWERRVELGQVLHALSMHVYFLRWSPQWAPEYAQEAKEWLGR
ncbi:phosphotransferase family protein [Kitasatospora viridis]|uniref:Aminoglycoside phosphotransferase (APT) family kinase protein n=1 Tax=Kitasatospora viridis TaxID=281105 RepID=A0A561TSL2_9ACTN|nr:aminoglycoside phosphotransferase family protein [Kitasatospora viridis]TWF90080.1 aminoglycoside phosphotransferase (APT) family kinase protein [Kitasatospora viridis]